MTSTRRRAQHPGFTLIELMVAVAVVGLIAVVAIPTYMSSVHRSRRAECRAALVQAIQAEERYFTNNNGYSGLAAIGTPLWSGNRPSTAGAACTLDARSGTVAAIGANSLTGSSNSVVVIATPNGWTDSECQAGAYALDNAGSFSPLTAALAIPGTASPANCF